MDSMEEIDIDFVAWKKRVNQQCFLSFGVEADDLPDRMWRDAFDTGESPKEAIEGQFNCDLDNLDMEALTSELF